MCYRGNLRSGFREKAGWGGGEPGGGWVSQTCTTLTKALSEASPPALCPWLAKLSFQNED
jgi:hypothetical protein